MALQALSTFASQHGSHDHNLVVTVTAAGVSAASFHIHQDNYLLHQSRQVTDSRGSRCAHFDDCQVTNTNADVSD